MDSQSEASELFNVGANLESMSDDQVQKLYKELLEKQGDQPTDPVAQKSWNTIQPTPGCCIKSKNTKTNEKVFINICTSSTVPNPEGKSEKELLAMLDKLSDPEEIVDYRIPMSLGEPHAELDNKGGGCTAYDVIINPGFLHTINNSQVFFGFFMSVVFEGLLNKYDVELDRKWILLKKKKFLGKLEEQNIRKQTLIREMSNKPNEVDDNIKKPKFKIMREPVDGHPDFLIAEVLLPGVKKATSVLVDVGEDRLVVCTRPKQYNLDIFLPFNLIQEDCGSQFDVRNSCLTVTMPVQKL